MITAARRSGGPALLVAAGMWLLVAVATVTTSADPDLWGHITFGRDILASGRPVQADRYSFTSDRPWMNHEWLSEVCFALVYGAGGSTGLIALKTTITAAILALLWFDLRRHGAVARIGTLLLFVAFIGTHWRVSTVRPQLFSVLFFTILLVIIARADRGQRWLLFAVPPMMALWTNLHGGWIVGLGTLGVWAVFELARPRASIGERMIAAAVGGASVAATVLNPYGIELWKFLWRTVGLQRPDIQEWQPLTISLAVVLPWMMMLAAGLFALWRGGRPRSPSYLVIIASLGVASLRVSRLDAFFCLSIVVLLTPQFVAALPSEPSRASILSRYELAGTGAFAITWLAVAGMVAYTSTIVAPATRCLSMDAAWMPDREAGRFIVLNGLRGRMLTWFDWGEYAIWHFGPALRVSYDGRRETVYSDQVIAAHGSLYNAAEGTPSTLRALDPDYAWVSNKLPLAKRMSSEGWITIFHSPVSSVFARAGSGPFRQVQGAAEEPRCFPGP